LARYDKQKFPKKDGQTYTACFAEKRCGKAFKMRDLSDIIWDVYSDNFSNQFKTSGWPMQYFVSAIQMLLVDYLPTYGADDEEQLYQSVYESIVASELISSLTSVA